MSETFWEPIHGPYPPEPEPCQYCSVMASTLKECDRSCDDLTEERWIELNATSSPTPCLATVRETVRFTTQCARPSGHEGAHQETP